MRSDGIRTVQFTQSTLVSICRSSTHVHQAHYRFQLSPDQATSAPRSSLSYKRGFHVDLHTSQSPIIACGCTRLENLFGTQTSDQVNTSIVLYTVKRKAEYGEGAPKREPVSREKTYLFEQAWQPSVPQTNRGMASFLSCLYCLTRSVPLKGVAAEVKVLSMLHQITGFPPAVRTCECLQLPRLTGSLILLLSVGILFLNKDVRSEERAALSDALYYALRDFLSCSSRGPVAIISNSDRFFEAASSQLSLVFCLPYGVM
jgi:hypothetical protein